MITFWNKREVFMGYSVQKFSQVRAILHANNIKYKYKVVTINGGAQQGRIGTLGENADFMNTYYIYVHKKDYNAASGILKGSNSET